MKKIYFIVPSPTNYSPSQRFRFEQYFSILKDMGYEFRVSSFLTPGNRTVFYRRGNLLDKAIALISGFSRRIIDLTRVPSYHYIFIHREAAPIGPPLIEWIITKVIGKKTIYDFDDAIWLSDEMDEPLMKAVVKARSKVSHTCRWSYKVSCGNEFLRRYALSYNNRAVCNPTVVDTNNYHNPQLHRRCRDEEIITIGWTGSHSTLKYLTSVEKVLNKIRNEYPHVRILIISDQRPDSRILSSFDFIPWRSESEIYDLLKVDIGIMPLPDDLWAKGKCGFKAIQYLALGIPAVVSPVGVNTSIVEHGVNGFLADSNEAWETSLTRLLKNKDLRRNMGAEGRSKMIDHYSVTSNLPTFLSLFE